MKLRVVFQNASLILIFCLLGLGVVELGARLLFGPPPQTSGVLFFSAPVFEGGGTSSVRFAPNRVMRALSIAGDHTEFDVHFKTNNFGLADDRAYPLGPKTRNIAIVGDSFTAGYHGGSPWVPELGNRVSDANIYNLGITGAGFVQFDQLQGELNDRLSINETLIIAISSDVARKSWRPVENSGRLFFCALSTRIDSCLKQKSSVYLLDGSESHDQILTTAQRHIQNSQKTGLRRYLSRHTYVGRLFHMRTWKKRSKKLDAQPVANFTIDALRRMKERLGDSVTLMHIPERREVQTGGYSADLSAVANRLGLKFIDGLSRCKLTPNDYYQFDSHPNRDGYEKIKNCVAGVLNGA